MKKVSFSTRFSEKPKRSAKAYISVFPNAFPPIKILEKPKEKKQNGEIEPGFGLGGGGNRIPRRRISGNKG